MLINELANDECREFLSRSRLGRLGCARDGQPYVVPFYFVFDGFRYLYAFSMPGQKIEWMRENPRVCVEVDEIESQDKWITTVIFGRYEELPDKAEFEVERELAHTLLAREPMWWQPAFVAGVNRVEPPGAEPVYFRISIEQISGHRAA